jgi:DNA/RNA endonuclease YhcR with UshA esterase domain
MKLPKPTRLMALAAIALAPLMVGPSFAAEKTKTPIISATDSKALKAHMGKKVSVEGDVVSVGRGPKDGMRFVNFGKSETTGFTAALVPAVYPKFPEMNDMVGKRVRVTGDLETYKKKSVIKVTRPTQVKVMKAPKAKVAEKKKASAQ